MALLLGLLGMGAIAAMVSTWPASAVAAVTVFVMHSLRRERFNRLMGSPGPLASKVSISVRGGRVSLAVPGAAVPELLAPLRPSAADFLVPIAATLVVLAILHAAATDATAALVCKIAYVGDPIAIVWLVCTTGTDESGLNALRPAIGRLEAQLQAGGTRLGELDGLDRAQAAEAHALGIAAPPPPSAALAAAIGKLPGELIADPSGLERLVASSIAVAERRLADLRQARSALARVRHEHERVAPAIFRTRSPSYLASLDAIKAQLEEARATLLPRADWYGFGRVCTTLLQQLELLDVGARSVTGTPRPRAAEHRRAAHDVLEVDPSATDAELKAQYRRLAKVWHPDRFVEAEMKVFANARLAEINAAFEELTGRRTARASR